MREIALFGEDRAHQLVVGALLRRLAQEQRVEVSLTWRQAYGGHGRMKHELNEYLRALRRHREPLPDLIVAATDANCKGLNARTREITNLDAQTPRQSSRFPTRISNAGFCSTAPRSRQCSIEAAEPRTENAIAIATSSTCWRRFGPQG